MIKSPTNCLAFKDLPFNVADSIEEYDRLAGKVGAALESANSNCLYRGSLADFRDQFCDWLETESGITRTSTTLSWKDEAKTQPKEVKWETEDSYWRRVAAAKGLTVEQFVLAYNAKAIELAEKVEFDPAARERKGPGAERKLREHAEKTADAIIAANGLTTVVTKLNTMLAPEVPFTNDKPGLVAAILVNEHRKLEEEVKRKANLATELLGL